MAIRSSVLPATAGSSSPPLSPVHAAPLRTTSMPELVCSTADRDAWLTARRSGVTATDIVTIMGLSAYDSPYSLYWRKLGQVPEVEDNDRFKLGRYLEPYARALWTDEHPDITAHEGGGLYRSDARPWQMATPDLIEYGAPTGYVSTG